MYIKKIYQQIYKAIGKQPTSQRQTHYEYNNSKNH